MVKGSHKHGGRCGHEAFFLYTCAWTPRPKAEEKKSAYTPPSISARISSISRCSASRILGTTFL